jgi:hypothetical protein
VSKKKRTEIPKNVAARVLFLHDRTCCVCRRRAKPVQVHHIDDDPSNQHSSNLAVLCFDCHRDTQVRGGFDRKLDAEQVILYRDDWIRIIARQRAAEEAEREVEPEAGENRRADVALATSIAEIYREQKEYVLLAIHYGIYGNHELRDKYIELALKQSPSDDDVSFLRGLQGRPDLIPKQMIKRKLKAHDKRGDHEQKARFLCTLGRYEEATNEYLRGILESLEDRNFFSAGYYLGELIEEGLREHLLEMAFRKAAEGEDLWWQVRALQELRWHSELKALLLQHADEIENSDDLYLQLELASVRRDQEEIVRIEKAIARADAGVRNDADGE